MNTYTQVADELLSAHGITFKAEKADLQTCPNWGECKPMNLHIGRGNAIDDWKKIPHNHGFKYICVFKRDKQEFKIDFWTSINDSYGNKPNSPSGFSFHTPKRPTAYDVMACISGDIGAHDLTFEEWARDLGYDTDSRQAEKIYNAVCDQSRKMARFFSPQELKELREIS